MEMFMSSSELFEKRWMYGFRNFCVDIRYELTLEYDKEQHFCRHTGNSMDVFTMENNLVSNLSKLIHGDQQSVERSSGNGVRRFARVTICMYFETLRKNLSGPIMTGKHFRNHRQD